MAKKKVLRSDLVITGIAPNLLLKDIENTAPWLFRGEIETSGDKRAYLAKVVFYKKNLFFSDKKHSPFLVYFTFKIVEFWKKKTLAYVFFNLFC